MRCVKDTHYDEHPNYFFGKEGKKYLVKDDSGNIWGAFSADYEYRHNFVRLHVIYRHPETKPGMCKALFDHWWRFNIYLQPKAGLCDFYLGLGFAPYEGPDPKFRNWWVRRRLNHPPTVSYEEYRKHINKTSYDWRKRNLAKWRKIEATYRAAAKTPEGKEKARKYYEKRRTYLNDYNSKYHKEHPEAQRRACRNYYKNHRADVLPRNRKARAKFLLKTETDKTRIKILKYIAKTGCFMDEAVVMVKTPAKRSK